MRTPHHVPIQPSPCCSYWQTCGAVVATLESVGKVTVPREFQSDGASIPSPLWPLIGHPWDRKYYPAAIIHDYLYRHQPVSRRQADQAFREMLMRLGVARWRCEAMYTGVRVGGWIGWNRKNARGYDKK